MPFQMAAPPAAGAVLEAASEGLPCPAALPASRKAIQASARLW